MAINHLASALTTVQLKILVFGPDPKQATTHPRSKAGKIAKKRIEIRDWLITMGHTAHFPEDIYAPGSSGSIANVPLQEIAMMRRYDVVIALVDSPGSHTELGYIAADPRIAQKSHVFVDRAYKSGFVYKTAQAVQILKGAFHPFKYPDDITLCHLRTKIAKTINDLCLAKYLLT